MAHFVLVLVLIVSIIDFLCMRGIHKVLHFDVLDRKILAVYKHEWKVQKHIMIFVGLGWQ